MVHWTALDEYGDRLAAHHAFPGRSELALNAVVEFDSPFSVAQAGGQVVVDDHLPDVHEPDVTWSEDEDVIVSDDWEPLTGYTGQYGYAGAIMHPSETLSGGLVRDILATPGTYCVVEVRDEDGSLPDGDPIGWAVCRLTD